MSYLSLRVVSAQAQADRHQIFTMHSGTVTIVRKKAQEWSDLYLYIDILSTRPPGTITMEGAPTRPPRDYYYGWGHPLDRQLLLL